jgi:ATP synthase protein I
MKRKERDKRDRAVLNSVMMLSAWGFIMVISSFLFMYAGRWIDVRFNTEPTFMIGLLFLGLIVSVIRLYKEAVERTRRIYRRDSAA